MNDILQTNNKTDKRILKTRKNIFDVFLQLLEEKTVGEITAQEIAELADISRSTFYQHYTDIYDLLDKAEDEIFTEISGLLKGYPYEAIRADPLSLFTELFYYFRHNAKICLVLINKNGSITTGQRISRMIQEKFRHEWEALISCDNDLEAGYVSQYVIAGFVGILQEWIAGGMKEPVEEMAYIARALINSSILGIRSNSSDEKEDSEMTDLKGKIRGDAKSFAGGVLGDTSKFLDDKSTEIQKKVENGLNLAGSRLAQRGSMLQTGRPMRADERKRQREKLLEEKKELDLKYQEKVSKLTLKMKMDELAKEQEKFERKDAALDRRLSELEALDSDDIV